MTDPSTDPIYALVHRLFEQQIPFNRLLGLRIGRLEEDVVSFTFDMRDELIGNTHRAMLHGGVISATLDVTGGLLAFVGVVKHMRGRAEADVIERFQRIGTIDLRVDYLRPGIGKSFVATAVVLRSGRRVAVMRTELRNDSNQLIATGTCTYIVA